MILNAQAIKLVSVVFISSVTLLLFGGCEVKDPVKSANEKISEVEDMVKGLNEKLEKDLQENELEGFGKPLEVPNAP